MRLGEIVIGSLFILISCVGFYDSLFRLGIGYGINGPEAGFIVFYLSLLQFIMAVVILTIGIRKVKKTEVFFFTTEARHEVAYVILTTAIFCGMMQWLGTYIAIFLYAILFTWWLGKSHWYGVLGLAVIMTAVIYFGFEQGLMIPLPKSPWYIGGFPI